MAPLSASALTVSCVQKVKLARFAIPCQLWLLALLTSRPSFLGSPFPHLILASVNPRLKSLRLLLRLSARETPLALLPQQSCNTYVYGLYLWAI
ncbi:hypothetical protein PS15p_210353 [Mucor circinelloides]